MNTSHCAAGRLLAVLFLALAIGCQQAASSTDTPTDAEAAANSEAVEADDGVKTVAAEQPIQSEAKVAEPEIFAAPLESEIEDDEAPLLILDGHPK